MQTVELEALRQLWLGVMDSGELPSDLELLGLRLEPAEIRELLVEMASGTKPCTTCCTQCAQHCCYATNC